MDFLSLQIFNIFIIIEGKIVVLLHKIVFIFRNGLILLAEETRNFMYLTVMHYHYAQLNNSDIINLFFTRNMVPAFFRIFYPFCEKQFWDVSCDMDVQ